MPEFSTVTVRRNVFGRDGGQPGVLLHFPYNESAQAALIHHIENRSDRYWWPERNAWWVAATHEDVAIGVLHAYYAEILFTGMEGESDYILTRDGEMIQQGGLFD